MSEDQLAALTELDDLTPDQLKAIIRYSVELVNALRNELTTRDISPNSIYGGR